MTPRRSSARERVDVTWLGHSAFLFRSPKGKILLIDPWLDNPKAPAGAKDIPAIDYILVTHGHADHLGNTVELARRTGAAIYAIYEIALYLQAQGLTNVQGMNKSGSAVTDCITITMTHAEHSSGLEPGGAMLAGGDPAGFVTRFENGFTVYHAGDTGLFGDMRLIGLLYKPDLAILPIGGFFTMGPREAAHACTLLKPKYVAGMHYGTFPVLKGTPQELRKELPPGLRSRVRVFEPGVPVAF